MALGLDCPKYLPDRFFGSRQVPKLYLIVPSTVIMVRSGYSGFCSGRCPCCPHMYPEPCQHTSTEEVLMRLCSLMVDDVGKSLVDRQLVLLEHFFGISDARMKLKEIRYFTIVLEFLCEFVTDIPQYKSPLWCLLRICQNPPKLKSTSEAAQAEICLSEFFTALGNCLTIVNDSDIQTLILEVLHRLLGKREQDEVPYEICVRALVKSQMSHRLTQSIVTMKDDFYPEILELTLKYAIVSEDFASSLLNSDVIFWLLNRLESLTRSSNSDTIHVKELTSSIIWRLFSSFKNTRAIQPLNSQDEILALLRKWFRREVLQSCPPARNDVATIICRILYLFPCHNVLKSGIFEDFSLLAFATEFNTDKSWAKDVQFPPTKENLKFKKILIAAICAMFKHPGIRTVADDYKALEGLALLLDTGSGCSETRHWPSEYRCQLTSYALHALPILAEHYPEKYTNSGATQKILELIRKSAEPPQHSEFIKCSFECLNRLILKKICLEHFTKSSTLIISLNIAYSLLKTPLSLMNQVLLNHCLILISSLSQISQPRSNSFDLIVAIGLELARRNHQPLEHDSKIDGSLQTSAVNFIWQTIVKNQAIKENFMEKGGAYLVLDWAERASLPVQVVILGMLADLSSDRDCIDQFVTWRGREEKKTILALLCAVWRKQEAVKGVKRDSDGCIADEEAILEGKVQRSIAPSWQHCPAIVEMMGCARAKIYPVFYNICHRYLQTVEATKNKYGVDFRNVHYHDEVIFCSHINEINITLRIIDNYEFFKKGEVWRNLNGGFRGMSILLLPHVEATLDILSKTYLNIAAIVQSEQKSIKKREVNKELDQEKALYDRLRSCMLTEALEAYMKIRKDLYVNSLEQTLKAKGAIEGKIAELREKEDVDISHPKYHAMQMVGFSLPTGPPTHHSRTRKNSNILRPHQFLDKKEFKINALGETSTISIQGKEVN